MAPFVEDGSLLTKPRGGKFLERLSISASEPTTPTGIDQNTINSTTMVFAMIVRAHRSGLPIAKFAQTISSGLEIPIVAASILPGCFQKGSE
jgi:hypothetical protein